MKRCVACRRELAVEMFGTHRATRDGLRPTCRTCRRSEGRAWRARNTEKLRRQKRAWREANRAAHEGMIRTWAAANPERIRESHRRSMRRRPSSRLDPAARAYWTILQGDPCAYCGDPMQEVDHIVARWVGGHDVWENLTAACKSCNASKRTTALLPFLLRRVT